MVKKFFGIFLLSTVLYVTYITSSYAGLGAATVYKVTMRKVEFCTASTGITDCENAVTIGTGDKVVDIAAVDAGSVAGSYGTSALLPLGETYTHMRVTIDRKFTIKGTATTDTSSYTCNSIATSSVQYASGNVNSTKYTHQAAIAKDGTLAEMEVYLMNKTNLACTAADCSSTSAASADYSSPTYASFQSQHATNDGSDDHVMVYALSSAYTVGMTPPIIKMSFGTQNALQARKVGNNLCAIDAMEPIFTISID